jgi:hypothetical protein
VLTWGYVVSRGPSSVLAKTRATAWALTLLRSRTRPVCPRAEARILRQHSPRPPVVGDAGGPIGRAVQSALGPLFDAAARVGLALLPGSLGDPADWQPREETAATEGNVRQDGSSRDLQVRLAGGPD